MPGSPNMRRVTLATTDETVEVTEVEYRNLRASNMIATPDARPGHPVPAPVSQADDGPARGQDDTTEQSPTTSRRRPG